VGVSIDQKSVHTLKAGRGEDRTKRGPTEGDCRTMTEPRSRGKT
jgi:hypothetical protein